MKKLLLILLCLPMIGFAQETGCISGDCENGQGTFTYASGSKYVGEWKDSLRHGQGTLVFLGEEYIGEWKNGSRDGKGICYYDSPTGTYEGEWKNNERHGNGFMTGDYGYSYTGEWKSGQRNGQGTEICCEGADGAVRITNGFWKEDVFIRE